MRIQIALDLVDLLKAVDMARDLCLAGADLIEAGTPLIKAYGIGAVGLIKAACPHAEAVADIKTADVGALEAELAKRAGADWGTVMAVVNLETVEEFARRAREIGLKTALDTIGLPSPRDRVLEILNRAPIDMVIFHLGIDVQKRRGLTIEGLADEAEKIKREGGVAVAVAGGIDERSLSAIRGRDIDVAIIGRAITSAKSPREAYLSLKSIITKITN